MKQEILKQLQVDIINVESKVGHTKLLYDQFPGNGTVYLCYSHMVTAAVQTYRVASHVVEAAQWTDVDVPSWNQRREELLAEIRRLEANNPFGRLT